MIVWVFFYLLLLLREPNNLLSTLLLVRKFILRKEKGENVQINGEIGESCVESSIEICLWHIISFKECQKIKITFILFHPHVSRTVWDSTWQAWNSCKDTSRLLKRLCSLPTPHRSSVRKRRRKRRKPFLL